MRTILAAASAVALTACMGGYTPGDSSLNWDGGPTGIGPGPDAGDAGPDAGDAGDAGPDAGPDAGCAALTLNGVPVIDGCHGGASTTATGTVNTTNCTLVFTMPTFAGPCAGTVSGANDAFDGGCESAAYACTSPSLPGDMTCTITGTICAVRICDAGAPCP